MEGDELESMSADDLWQLYEAVGATLTRMVAVEKVKLEQRLRQIESAGHAIGRGHARRSYPRVVPKKS